MGNRDRQLPMEHGVELLLDAMTKAYFGEWEPERG